MLQSSSRAPDNLLSCLSSNNHSAIAAGQSDSCSLIIDHRESTARYTKRIHELFTHDFNLSTKGAELVYKYPILLDACANEMQRKGDAMMSKWAEVRSRKPALCMTCSA